MGIHWAIGSVFWGFGVSGPSMKLATRVFGAQGLGRKIPKQNCPEGSQGCSSREQGRTKVLLEDDTGLISFNCRLVNDPKHWTLNSTPYKPCVLVLLIIIQAMFTTPSSTPRWYHRMDQAQVAQYSCTHWGLVGDEVGIIFPCSQTASKLT